MQSPIANRDQYLARGFSFVELMFAVVVLGIGFIMIAAVFPVGLQQTKLSLDESTAAQNSRGNVAAIEQIGSAVFQYTNLTSAKDVTNSTSIFPASVPSGTTFTVARVPLNSTVSIPGVVYSLRDPRNAWDIYGTTQMHADVFWNRLATQAISASDDRNAIAVLYKRDLIANNPNTTPAGVLPITAKASSSAQLIVINAQSAAHSNFALGSNISGSTAGDLLAPSASKPTIYNLEPRPVGITITYNSTLGSYQAVFSSVIGLVSNGYTYPNKTEYNSVLNGIAEGTYIVISDDQIAAPSVDIGRMNGHIFKVGVSLGTNTWQLAPAYDFTPDGGNSGALADSNGDDIVELGVNATAVSPLTSTAGNGVSPTAYDATNVKFSGTPAIAFVLGKGFDNLAVTPGQTGGTSNYAGPAQDIAIYTTFINVP